MRRDLRLKCGEAGRARLFMENFHDQHETRRTE